MFASLLLTANLKCSSLLSLPTDVQAEAIPLILGGGDVLMVRNLEKKLSEILFITIFVH